MVSSTPAAREARLRRRVAREGNTLHRSREDTGRYRDLGRYYVVDHFNNEILAWNLDHLDDVEEWLADSES